MHEHFPLQEQHALFHNVGLQTEHCAAQSLAERVNARGETCINSLINAKTHASGRERGTGVNHRPALVPSIYWFVCCLFSWFSACPPVSLSVRMTVYPCFILFFHSNHSHRLHLYLPRGSSLEALTDRLIKTSREIEREEKTRLKRLEGVKRRKRGWGWGRQLLACRLSVKIRQAIVISLGSLETNEGRFRKENIWLSSCWHCSLWCIFIEEPHIMFSHVFQTTYQGIVNIISTYNRGHIIYIKQIIC